MADDLEDDWESLGRPTKVQKAVRKAVSVTKEKSMGFLEFLFAWIGKAWDAWWKVFLNLRVWATLAGLLILAGLATMCILSARSDGKIDYCYVDPVGIGADKKSIALYGHRPWKFDAELKILPIGSDPAPLYALAKEIDCPLR